MITENFIENTDTKQVDTNKKYAMKEVLGNGREMWRAREGGTSIGVLIVSFILHRFWDRLMT